MTSRNPNYPDNWDKIRKKIYRRDNYTCQQCGAQNVELHAHHITPISQGGSHNPKNLATVCKSCHEKIHGHSIGGKREKDFPFWEFVFGAFLGLFMSIAIPPMAIVGIPMAIFCIIAIVVNGYGDE